MSQAILIGRDPATGKDLGLALRMANRHGLIAGATGTGKTISLQVLAEGFARNGVPVFLADVKGDLSGISQVGGDHAKAVERAAILGLQDWVGDSFPTGTCSGAKAIRSAPRSRRWGRCCSRTCWD
jgi:hypothetical protein